MVLNQILSIHNNEKYDGKLMDTQDEESSKYPSRAYFEWTYWFYLLINNQQNNQFPPGFTWRLPGFPVREWIEEYVGFSYGHALASSGSSNFHVI